MIEVAVAIEAQDELGESPVWRADTGQLLRVDILNGALHSWDPETRREESARFDGELAAVIPCADGELIIALGHELIRLDRGGGQASIATIEPEKAANRLNDCRCDAGGALWAGTMSKTRQPRQAALYRLSPAGELSRVLAPTTLSNGIGWSPDGTVMYFIDSTTQRVDVFDFDVATGTMTDRRLLASVEPADGLPDGLTVDSEGGIWISLFGGSAVRRYGPDGTLEEQIRIPTPHPTCPVFGGADLRTLYITSTRHRLSDTERAAFPLAGSVFCCRPGVQGRPDARFGEQRASP